MKTVKKAYTQNWRAYNAYQMNEKELFMDLLSDICRTVEEPEYRFGRPKIPLSDIVFCCALKVYSMKSGRRFSGDMRQAEKLGYITHVPHYNSIFNYLKRPKIKSVLSELIGKTSLPLAGTETRFAVDSSGFSGAYYDRWAEYKYITSRRKGKTWTKCHIICGTKTNIITSVRLSDSDRHDSAFFSDLVLETSGKFNIKEVSADKAYLSSKNLSLVDELGGTAYIPFKSNSISRARHPRIWKKMYHHFMSNREEFMEHYHKRSNVETAFHMIKSKFGSSLKTRDRTAQHSEILCKVLCHNICVMIREMHRAGLYKKTGYAS